MHSIKPLENLIIAVLFSESKLVNSPNGKELSFHLAKRKIQILENYINRNKISSQITFDINSLEGRIKHSVILERFIREWTADGVVHAVDPRKIRTSMYILWICLFARKTEKSVIIDTNLSDGVLNSLTYFFRDKFDATLICKGKLVYIKSFHKIVLSSHNHIPALETGELIYLLTQRESEEFKKKINETEGDR